MLNWIKLNSLWWIWWSEWCLMLVCIWLIEIWLLLIHSLWSKESLTTRCISHSVTLLFYNRNWWNCVFGRYLLILVIMDFFKSFFLKTEVFKVGFFEVVFCWFQYLFLSFSWLLHFHEFLRHALFIVGIIFIYNFLYLIIEISIIFNLNLLSRLNNNRVIFLHIWIINIGRSL